MEFKYIITDQLSSVERKRLAWQNEPFFFIRTDGIIKINPLLPSEVLRIAAEMWSIDRYLEEEDDLRLDKLRTRLAAICGTVGADQLFRGWSYDHKRKLDADDEAAAREWLNSIDLINELDALYPLTEEKYNCGFLNALYRITENVEAIFLFGYKMGAGHFGYTQEASAT